MIVVVLYMMLRLLMLRNKQPLLEVHACTDRFTVAAPNVPSISSISIQVDLLKKGSGCVQLLRSVDKVDYIQSYSVLEI
jgi:hypothetical protein